MKWADSSDPNLRRAACEGLRGVARRNPQKIIPLLEKLNRDESLYVRKAVAASLRAISKKHPEVVVELCRRWSELDNKYTKWIVRHGIKKLPECKQCELLSLISRDHHDNIGKTV